MSRDTDLLARMATDLRLAGKAERTVEAYTGAVRRLVRRTGKPLAEIEEADVREYLLAMVEAKVARGTFSINLCGIRFFWMDTMGLDWKIFGLAKPRYDKRLRVPGSSGQDPEAEGAAMTSIMNRCAAIRICGSGKLRSETKSAVSSAWFPSVNSSRSNVFGHLERLPAAFFGASPDRFALRIHTALD